MISNRDILKLETRRKIYSFIEKNPGLHIREIVRRLNIPRTTLQYHLKHLEKLKLIEGTSDKNCVYYYPKNRVGTKEKQVLKLLRKKIVTNIYLCLSFNLSCSQIELSRELELPPQTISRYLKKMLKLDIIKETEFENGYVLPFTEIPEMEDFAIKKERASREKFYRRNLNEVCGMIYRLLYTHKDSFLHTRKLIEEYYKYFEGLDEFDMRVIEGGETEYFPKIIIDKKDNDKKIIKIIPTLDSFIDAFEDIVFKPPFCS